MIGSIGTDGAAARMEKEGWSARNSRIGFQSMDAGRDRVRRNTAARVLAKLDAHTAARIYYHAQEGKEAISARIARLDREWTLDRALMTGAGVNVLVGLFLGRKVDRAWQAFPAAVASFLILYAIQGWCPPLPILRRLGFRSAKEVALEKYALKALRGDFDALARETGGLHARIDQAVAAAH